MSYNGLKFHAAPEEFIWTVISTAVLFLIRLSSRMLGINTLPYVFRSIQSKRKKQVLLGSPRQKLRWESWCCQCQISVPWLGFWICCWALWREYLQTDTQEQPCEDISVGPVKHGVDGELGRTKVAVVVRIAERRHEWNPQMFPLSVYQKLII